MLKIYTYNYNSCFCDGFFTIPSLVFNGKRQTPKTIYYLGKTLPLSVMAMLVVYCFRSVSFAAFPFGIPELIAGGFVVLLHVCKSNTLLSICLGTTVYILLLRTMFA